MSVCPFVAKQLKKLHISVEDGKLETYLPTERHWSGYVSFSFNQNRFYHVIIILT